MQITTHGGTTDAADKTGDVVAVGSMPLLDCCPDWSKQLRFYNQPEVLAAIDKDGRFRAEGKHWNYCPWCGKKNPYAEEKQSNESSSPTAGGGTGGERTLKL